MVRAPESDDEDYVEEYHERDNCSSDSDGGSTTTTTSDVTDNDQNTGDDHGNSLGNKSPIEGFEDTVKQSMIQWVAQCNIPRCHVSNLLKRLHHDAQLTFLPLDARTLLSSKREKLDLVDIPPGKYYHFSVENGLVDMLTEMDKRGKDIPNELKLLVNVDGIPLSKSSSSEFWPILVKVLGE